jgi:hypothetical protein
LEYTPLNSFPYYKDCAPLVEGLGFQLVELRIIPAKTVNTARVVIARKSDDETQGITVNDCAKVHRLIQPRLEALISSIINSLYSGNYLDEFLLCKNLLASAITDGNIKTETVSTVNSEATAKSFITKAREYFTNFAFPTSNYNAYTPATGEDPVITWTPNEDVRFIIRSDINAFVDVNVLASAFNMNKADFLGKTLIVDNFGSAENCYAMMFDKSYTQIYDNYREMTEFFNGETLTWNYYYHVWQTYSVSTLCNAVAFVTE